MVDAPDSKSGEGNLVRVRVSPALPKTNKTMKNIFKKKKLNITKKEINNEKNNIGITN